AVLALKAAKELGAKNTLLAHIVLEEEFGGNGTLALLETKYGKGPVADALVNLEPTNLALKSSVRGAVWFDMVFHGIAGHAGSAGSTDSAIYKAIAAVDLLRSYHAELYENSKDFGRFREVKNPMPLTIGMFHAGVWPSMVPNEARIRGIIGLLPNKTKREVMDDITELFRTPETRRIGDGMEIRFDYRHNGFELPDGHFLNTAMEKAMTECGLDPKPCAMTASTDAIFYVERGIPAVVFGPGLLEDAHSVHEKIRFDDVVKAAEALYLLACDEIG
ncbi:MAG: M20/M25/M40 family metallo-hydrolase, partial [Treponema sp.]|nr:M20/M25/M40 family metallo-hydrolase [Treponema sp.]